MMSGRHIVTGIYGELIPWVSMRRTAWLTSSVGIGITLVWHMVEIPGITLVWHMVAIAFTLLFVSGDAITSSSKEDMSNDCRGEKKLALWSFMWMGSDSVFPRKGGGIIQTQNCDYKGYDDQIECARDST